MKHLSFCSVNPKSCTLAGLPGHVFLDLQVYLIVLVGTHICSFENLCHNLKVLIILQLKEVSLAQEYFLLGS